MVDRHAGALLPPSLEAHVEDRDAEREVDHGAEDGEICETDDTRFGSQAEDVQRQKMGIRRREWQGGVEGRRRVDKHSCVQGAGGEKNRQQRRENESACGQSQPDECIPQRRTSKTNKKTLC